MNFKNAGHKSATVELYIDNPALAASTFDLARTYARSFGLPDIGRMSVQITIEFSGQTHEEMVDRFNEKLDELWLGQIVELSQKDWAKRRGERE